MSRPTDPRDQLVPDVELRRALLTARAMRMLYDSQIKQATMKQRFLEFWQRDSDLRSQRQWASTFQSFQNYFEDCSNSKSEALRLGDDAYECRVDFINDLHDRIRETISPEQPRWCHDGYLR